MDVVKKRAALRSFLETLNRDDRYALMLSHVDQLTAREISVVLNRPLAWVHATLTRLDLQVRNMVAASPAAPAVPAHRLARYFDRPL